MNPHSTPCPPALTPDEPSSVAPMPADDPEVQRIQRVYAGYAARGVAESKWSLANPGNAAMREERMRVLARTLGRAGFASLTNRKILEIGCGQGRVLGELAALGAAPSLLSGVDLLPDRIESARRACPLADLRVADARSLPFAAGSFDLVAAFTVFSSVLDPEIARNIAREMDRVLKPGGAAVCYDFKYNNPRNPSVRGVRRSCLESCFPGFSCHWQSLTLLPPLARKLGALTAFAYPVLAAIAPLRTHFLGLLVKPVAR
ncbi:MAG: class I SAM-dependent methyltransferase [Limisphaerales bacterium]